MAAALAPTEQIPGRKLVAPLWHTFVFLTFLAGYSLIEIGRVARLESRNSSSRLPQYLLMICFELTLVGYVWFLGLRPTGTTISDPHRWQMGSVDGCAKRRRGGVFVLAGGHKRPCRRASRPGPG